VIANLVERLRGAAERLGCAPELGRVRAMVSAPCGAERQLAVFERTGDLVAVARHMAGGSAPGPDLRASSLHSHEARGVAGTAAGVVALPFNPAVPVPVTVGQDGA
jgi:hypothetical protein